jgi:hypothetical protein
VLNPDQEMWITAECPAGKVATGGGYFQDMWVASTSSVTYSHSTRGSDPTYDGTGWQVLAKNTGTGGIGITVTVICATPA